MSNAASTPTSQPAQELPAQISITSSTAPTTQASNVPSSVPQSISVTPLPVVPTTAQNQTVESTQSNIPITTPAVKAEKDFPKVGMVKPQNVLTHVIEGFVIQEAAEPFAVNRPRYPERKENDEPPSKYYEIIESILEKYY